MIDTEILTRSHRSVTRLEVLDRGAPIDTAPVLGGAVNLDSTASVRRRLRATVLGLDRLIPRGVESALAPYGNEVKISRGHPDRLWSVGVFRIEVSRTVDDGGRVVALEAYDRSDSIARNRPTRPLRLPGGTLITDGIAALARNRLPGVPVNLSPSSRRLVQAMIWEPGADIWRTGIERLAESIGHEAFFDGDGVLTTRPPPALVEANVAVDFTDRARSAMVGVENVYSADPGYNVFHVTGEAARNAAPVMAIAKDLDPSSPTYVLGKYGERARFYRSEFIHTTRQAQDAADGLLARELGGTEQLRVTHWPLSYLEGSDVLHVGRDAAGVDELASIQATTIDLAPDAAVTTTTRRRRTLVAA